MNTSCPSHTNYYLIKTISKWALSSVQLTVGSTEGATERNKPFPRKVCITACCASFRTKHCVNRNGGMHSCAARQEGNYTLTQSSDSHSWSSAHKKHTGTVPSWTQAVRPTQNTDLEERFSYCSYMPSWWNLDMFLFFLKCASEMNPPTISKLPSGGMSGN